MKGECLEILNHVRRTSGRCCCSTTDTSNYELDLKVVSEPDPQKTKRRFWQMGWGGGGGVYTVSSMQMHF